MNTRTASNCICISNKEGNLLANTCLAHIHTNTAQVLPTTQSLPNNAVQGGLSGTQTSLGWSF